MDERLRGRLVEAAQDEMTLAPKPWGDEATADLNSLIDRASTRPEPPGAEGGVGRRLGGPDYFRAEENMRWLARTVNEIASKTESEWVEPWMIEAGLRRLCPIWPFCKRPIE